MNVTKRSNRTVPFDKKRISTAIKNAMKDTPENNFKIYHSEANLIADHIEQKAINFEGVLHVEDIQDMIELSLMSSEMSELKNVAKHYILYRYQKSHERVQTSKKVYKFLDDEFISEYKHIEPPMTDLGQFVYQRTYARWYNEYNRREFWWETVRRAVEYNCSLGNTGIKEAQELFDNVFHLRQFLSGRTLWVGGTEVSDKYPTSNYNCAFTSVETFDDFRELFYLLMVGSGVGVRITIGDVSELPKIRTNVKTIHSAYIPVAEKRYRKDSTELTFSGLNKFEATITVGDSKEGWVQALDYYLKLLYQHDYRDITTIYIEYDNVRGKGEKLSTFGGTASGHESLLNMFVKIDKVLKAFGTNEARLRPIDCLDIANIIGHNVVVGGVRRTAEIGLLDENDNLSIHAKDNLYHKVGNDWIFNNDISHRQMSNNSIYYTTKPTRERLHWQIERMRHSGEPAWVNAEVGHQRRDNFNGVNPCGEILLDNKGLCNLTTVNVFSFITDSGNLDRDGLKKAQRLSARAGYRMSLVELELPQWDKIQKRDHLVGCSLTGWQDMVNALSMTREDEIQLLTELREVAHIAIDEVAKENNSTPSILITTVKPEGTLSQLPTVSSGVHYSHSQYYLRRVRINAHDPLVKVLKELEYTLYPENGQKFETANTLVVEFPIEAPQGRTKYDVSAIEQLENYLMFQRYYTDHNTSITVHVRNHEWEQVEEWVWEHWDEVMAVSFLSLDDSFYELLPYEAIEEEKYLELADKMKPYNPKLLQKYDLIDQESELDESDCESGVCPVR